MTVEDHDLLRSYLPGSALDACLVRDEGGQYEVAWGLCDLGGFWWFTARSYFFFGQDMTVRAGVGCQKQFPATFTYTVIDVAKTTYLHTRNHNSTSSSQYKAWLVLGFTRGHIGLRIMRLIVARGSRKFLPADVLMPVVQGISFLTSALNYGPQILKVVHNCVIMGL